MPYLRHFELREAPFGLTPDTSFLFPCRSVQQTLEALRTAVSSGEAFIEVTGAAGMGKTLLCRAFIALLDRAKWVALHIPNPAFDPRSLSIALAEALSVPLSAPTGAELDQHSLRRGIARALLAHARAGKRVVLCMDESQAMPLETLEALRLLTNLETGKRKLFQVVLFGQPELDLRLDSETAGQLRQRISVRREHGGLAKDEVGAYISHRLKVAGYAGPPLFANGAVALIERSSQGVPRRVNMLCHKALLLAFGEGGHRIERRHVHAALHDLPGAPRAGLDHREVFWRSVAALMLVGVASATWFAYELRPRPALVTSLAFKSQEQVRVRTGPLMQAPQIPVEASVRPPTLFKLAWTLETPITSAPAR